MNEQVDQKRSTVVSNTSSNAEGVTKSVNYTRQIKNHASE